MTSTERLVGSLTGFLKEIEKHCCQLSETKQPFGLCIANPNSPHIPPPTSEIQSELKNQASEYFKAKQCEAFYFRYWTPPSMPGYIEDIATQAISADDYQLTLQIPQFDMRWQQTVFARNLIYCPLDPTPHEYLDWFEIQEEAIRLTPIVHQAVKELEIMANIERALSQPAMPFFELFIYEYGSTDQHQAMSKENYKKWKTKEINWKDRYKRVPPIIKPARTVHDLYGIAHEAASSRNPILKALFRAFVEHIEENFIIQTQLPEEIKKRLLDQLRKTKKRPKIKGEYIAKRPAISVSDIECGQMLYVMIIDYLNQNDKALAEAIFFIWIAQHGAFSDLHVTVDGILSIKINDINLDAMTILMGGKEINTTDGLNKILSDLIGTPERKNKRKFFLNITNDSLEDILSKYSKKLFGNQGKLSPRDFLEKVHVVPGVLMPLDLRRRIIEQEKLVKDSPYRIKSEKIKKDIKESINKITA